MNDLSNGMAASDCRVPRRYRFRLSPEHIVLALLAVSATCAGFAHIAFLPKGFAALFDLIAVTGGMLLLLVWLALALVFRRKFQFGVRSLLLFAVAVALLCGLLTSEWRAAENQREAVNAILAASGQAEEDGVRKPWGVVTYDYQPLDPINRNARTAPWAPALFRRAFGVDFFADVDGVCFCTFKFGGGFSPTARVVEIAGPVAAGGSATDASLGYVGRLSRLRSLDINYCSEVTDRGFENIRGLGQLRWLFAGCTGITRDGLKNLKPLVNLAVLNLDRTPVFNAGLENLSEMSKLESLSLCGTKVGDRGMERLAALPSLRSLYLGDNRISDSGVKHLESLRELTELDLSRTDVTDDGLAHIRQLTRLKKLDLDFTKVSDAGLENLAALSSLEELNLSGTDIRGPGLRYLRSLTNLKVLDLNHSLVTDGSLDYLKGLNQLTSLDLRITPSTDAAVSSLHAALPNCKIQVLYGKREWQGRKE